MDWRKFHSLRGLRPPDYTSSIAILGTIVKALTRAMFVVIYWPSQNTSQIAILAPL